MPPGEWGTGGLLVLLALAAALGRALDTPIQWLLCLLGWRKAKVRESEKALHDLVDRKVGDAVEQAMSPVRQHLADVQKGLDGKQNVLEDRLAMIDKDFRARDEELAKSLHKRMSAEFRDHRNAFLQDLDRHIAGLREHFSDVLHHALNGRKRD